MLANLNSIALSARQRFRDEFSAREVVLSSTFKEAYAASLRNDSQNVEYTAHTAIVTTSNNLKMYIPNQWFCAAAYMVEFIKTFNEYKRITDAVISETYTSTQDRKDYIKRLKESSDDGVIEIYRSQVQAHLSDNVPEEELAETVSLLTRFATDYSWWFGSKTIDRGDAYVSPVLSLLGVVNASQSYIADISNKFASDNTLGDVALEMVDPAARVDLAEITVTPTEGITHPRVTGGINEIVYGAPGTGKSRYLDDQYGTANYQRVVFHPEYTFFDFVGSYKPVMLYKSPEDELHTLSGQSVTIGDPVVDYRFIPGPFIDMLVNAWLNPATMHTLIIEEINRANTAAVFGDFFQLLDRDVNGTSEYKITPPRDLSEYLLSIPGMETYLVDGLRIPSNMNLVATMNSADQGVMPMDSAFKRRWSFKYTRVSIDGAIHENAPLRYAGHEVTWGRLVKSINAKLMGLGLEEDRLVGPYFIKPEEIGSRRATDKLLLYLWDDVLRYNRDSFFSNQILVFSDLSDKFEDDDVFDLLAGPHGEALLGHTFAEINEDENDDITGETPDDE